MNKRSLGIVVGVVAIAAALLLWKCGGSSAPSTSARQERATGPAVVSSADRWSKPKVDPKTKARASVSGTIKNDEGAGIAGARVCALVYTNEISQELLPDPFCTTADDKGQYTIKDLFADELTVSAMAKPYQPGVYYPKGTRHDPQFSVAPGEAKTGIDIVLRKGGVEITGTVSDLTGGPIANALVSASAGWRDRVGTPAVETDAKGTFSLWVRPGEATVQASAEGYASNSETGKAPGTFDILLTPEGSLAGMVVDATSGKPIAGVPVEVGDARWGAGDKSDISDEQGKFRVTRLEPGRYTVFARGEQGYGRSDGSSLVGLGQHVDGVVVKLHPGFRVSGRVMKPDKTVCAKGWLALEEKERNWSVSARREPDGTLVAHGVLPGTYSVSVGCQDFDSRDKYEPITIVDKNIDDRTWEVDAGATLRGRVLTKSGAPIESASIWGRSTGGEARSQQNWLSDTSGADGAFEMKGVRAGAYTLEVGADKGVAPEDGWPVDVKAGGVTEKDLVLDDGGSIKGLVVDVDGKPVRGVTIQAFPIAGSMRFFGNEAPVRTNEDGSFQIDDLRPGAYRVYATMGTWSNDLRKPGTTDDDKQGEKATVAANQVATVKLVVEAPTGAIKGTVVDSAGAPVSDAFVVAARESDAAGANGSSIEATRWSWDQRPVLTGTDGTFTVTKLARGNYTIRAHRKGGGEAVAEHVAVGSTTKLQIKATGTISGFAKRDGGAPEELTLAISDPKTGFSRDEKYFRTGGAFTVRDLPAGTFTIKASAEGGEKQVTVTLGEGEQKSGVLIELEPLVVLVGRVVDRVTKAPIPAIRMIASIGKDGGFSFGMNEDEEQLNITGTDGAFTIKRAPRGEITLRGFAKDWQDSEYGFIQATRTVTGTGTIDVGEISVLKKRLKKGETGGDLGLNFKEQPRGTPIDQRVYEVSFIDPKGPAVQSGIKVGDVIISVDGVDITGANAMDAWVLLNALPGTKLELGLKRGVTVSITLGPPD